MRPKLYFSLGRTYKQKKYGAVQMSYNSGVIVRNDESYKVLDLPETVGVNPTLLNAPIYVLSDKAAKNINEIEISWKQKLENGDPILKIFRFFRQANTPFPTVIHAKYLDILLAMFAQNWNEEGILYFRYSDILKLVGLPGNSRAREAIQQTILRYRRNTTEWENIWGGRVENLNFSIIEMSSILDKNDNIIPHSSRRSLNKEDWHSVGFNKYIVQALKNDHKRILLTELFKKLDHGTFCVYRYYYGYPDFYIDANGVYKPNVIWRSYESLRDVFRWTGQKNRFRIWIDQRFQELFDYGLIDEPIRNNDAIGIHCKNLKQLQQEQDKNNTIEIVDDEQKPSKKRPQKVKKVSIKNLTDEAILKEYFSKKSRGLIQKEKQEVIDLMIKNNLSKAAIDLIRSHVF